MAVPRLQMYRFQPFATEIGTGSFNACSALTSIDLLSNVTAIGDRAFSGCSSLTSLDLSNAATIGNSAFSGCTGLTAVSMPSVTSIGEAAFKDCASLVTINDHTGDIVFPNTLKSIGAYAFDGCEAYLCQGSGKGVTELGKYISNCSQLQRGNLRESCRAAIQPVCQ